MQGLEVHRRTDMAPCAAYVMLHESAAATMTPATPNVPPKPSASDWYRFLRLFRRTPRGSSARRGLRTVGARATGQEHGPPRPRIPLRTSGLEAQRARQHLQTLHDATEQIHSSSTKRKHPLAPTKSRRRAAEGIPDRPALVEHRQPFTPPFAALGWKDVRIEPRLGYTRGAASMRRQMKC